MDFVRLCLSIEFIMVLDLAACSNLLVVMRNK